MQIQTHSNLSLAQFTTFELGGPARYFFEAEKNEQVEAAVRFAKSRSLPLFVLGGGSNLVVSEAGISGLVMRMATRGISTVVEHDAAMTLRVSAGVSWDDFVKFAVDQDLVGIECLSGIPGSVGATPIQNVGAYGQEVAQTLVRVEAYDCLELRRVSFERDECELAYRHSRFKGADAGRYVILDVEFELRRQPPALPRHPELVALLDTERPSTREIRARVLELRAKKRMRSDDPTTRQRCAGSFFVNPIVDSEQARQLLDGPGHDMPTYSMPDGRTKLAAAWLIEHAGFPRGTSDGRVGLSPHHCLVLVAHDGASSRDVIAFAQRIRAEVFTRFGVMLEPEPNFWGFDEHSRSGLPMLAGG